MKILILGGDGMLGHQLSRNLRSRHELRVTLRQDFAAYRQFGLFDEDSAYSGIDAGSIDCLTEVFSDFQPEAVINGIGVIKQRATAKEAIPSIEINSLLPHRLALLCRDYGSRLVHLSTDCVFSGKKGNYQEPDPSDADDLYGKSKFLGEVHDEHCLTLRTSIIGRELSRKQSLVEWFLGQSGPIKGFQRAIYSGFPTLEMGRIIEKMLIEHPDASGVYQVSSDPISKFELLSLIKERMSLDIEIVPDRDFSSDKSLDSARFRREFDYSPPSWPRLIEEMVRDYQGSNLYDKGFNGG